MHKWFSVCHFGSVVSVKVSAERKAPLFFLEASPLVTSADTEASTHKRENKPFGTLGSDRQTC